MNLSICSNPSSRNVTSSYWRIVHGGGGLVEATFILFIIVVSLPWNILVIFTILKQRLYKQPSILLLLNLAISDILLILFTLPVYAANGLTSEYFSLGRSDLAKCNFCHAEVIIVIQVFDAFFLIGLMSVDRLLFIVKPLRYYQIVTSCKLKIAMILTSFLSVIVAVLMIGGFNTKNEFLPDFMSCWLPFEKNNYPYYIIPIVIGLSNLLLIIISNVWIVVIVQRNIKSIYKSSKSSDNKELNCNIRKQMETIRLRKQLHLFQVFGAILLANLCCWLPFTIVLLLRLILGSRFVEHFNRAGPAVTVLLLSMVLFHPIVETVLLKDVRELLKKLVTCGRHHKNKDSYQSKSTSALPSNNDQHGSCNCSNLWTLLNAGMLSLNLESQDHQKKGQEK